ncbi:MAG: hypothetical protein V4737_16895 [Curtobacterium sp.]
MSDDKEALGNLASRSWRNYHRSRRLHEMREDARNQPEDLVISDWWLEDQPEASDTNTSEDSSHEGPS